MIPTFGRRITRRQGIQPILSGQDGLTTQWPPVWSE
jgi:hypothetical protein